MEVKEILNQRLKINDENDYMIEKKGGVDRSIK